MSTSSVKERPSFANIAFISQSCLSLSTVMVIKHMYHFQSSWSVREYIVIRNRHQPNVNLNRNSNPKHNLKVRWDKANTINPSLLTQTTWIYENRVIHRKQKLLVFMHWPQKIIGPHTNPINSPIWTKKYTGLEHRQTLRALFSIVIS